MASKIPPPTTFMPKQQLPEGANASMAPPTNDDPMSIAPPVPVSVKKTTSELTSTTKPTAIKRNANSDMPAPPTKRVHAEETASSIAKSRPTRASALAASARLNKTLTTAAAAKSMGTTVRPRPGIPARPTVTPASTIKPKPGALSSDVMLRLLKMEERHNELEETNTILKNQISEICSKQFPSKIETQSAASSSSSSVNSELFQEQLKKNAEILVQVSTLQAKYDQAIMEKENLQRQIDTAKLQIATLNTSISSQSSELVKKETQIRELNCTIEALRSQLKETEEKLNLMTQSRDDITSQLLKAMERIKELESQSIQDETFRRKLHNQIQELKGNIRVFCRVRPPSKSDPADTVFTFPKSTEDRALGQRSIEITAPAGTSLTGENRSKTLAFSFDRVFPPEASQADVFEEISQLVQSVLDGYNCCIFAYGQTGSGKTYTMEGPEIEGGTARDVLGESRGMIARAVDQIFSSISKLKEKEWNFVMESSFLEIYNEIINDLLFTGKGEEPKHVIKHDANEKVVVSDLTVVPITNRSQVHNLLKIASSNRAVAATKCNERSSRSHSVFILKLTGTNESTKEVIQGVLNLVDLAGSERLKESQATGDRLKETQAINKSLSGLTDVICALANKESHIPYRNVKLTHILQDSLGGNSKTLMFVNVSPSVKDANETINSLRFATKVNSCDIGTAKKQVK
eukprot:TRINITY_DN11965_c0_g1_i1.p1 TRINITY_DN11965_c0_g1~~TRINITY_DN11965_c0_g1_i1.p1  ORF type:complete len:701 (-),score=206.18 TRINITY_DN11965_c0_g1_i1:78-2156(-)